MLRPIPYKWRVYIHGLVAAVLSSVSNSITLAFVDPQDFNPQIAESWDKITALVIVSAIVGFFTYTKTHPLPDPDKDTDYTRVSREAVARIQSTGDGNTGSDGVGRMPVVLLAASLLAASSCALTTARPTLPATPQVLECAADIRPCVKYALDLLETAADLGLKAQSDFLLAERLGVVPANVAPRIHTSFARFSELGLRAVRAVRLAQSIADIQEGIAPVLAAARTLRTEASTITAPQPNSWKQLVMSLVPIAVDAVTQGGRR